MKNKFNFSIVLILFIYLFIDLSKELMINNYYQIADAITIKWENNSIDFYNNKLYFKYYNEDKKKQIYLEKNFRLRSEREFIWNQNTFKIKYCKYFSNEPIIVGEKRVLKNFAFALLFFSCLFYLILFFRFKNE